MRRVVESRNVVFIETPPNLLSAARRLSPQQDLESPSYGFSDNTLDDNYVLHNDILRDVQNYTSALDFGFDTSTGTVDLLLPQQASHGVTSPGGALAAEKNPGGVTPKGSSPPPAPTSTSAAPRATNVRASRATVGVTPAVTRSRAASVLPVPVATRYGGGRNNNIATLAEMFQVYTLQHLRELRLRSPCYTEDIAHQAENASLNAEYAYVATNELGSISRGESKKQIPNAEAMTSHKWRVGRWLQTRRSRVWKSMACTSW